MVHELQGSAALDFRPEGLQVMLSLPMAVAPWTTPVTLGVSTLGAVLGASAVLLELSVAAWVSSIAPSVTRLPGTRFPNLERHRPG